MTNWEKKGAPGTWLKRSAERYGALKIFLEHGHMLQIIEDHQLMWHEAADEAERESIRARLRRQLARAGAHIVGWEMVSHGGWALFASPMLGGALLGIGAVVVYFTRTR